MKLSLIIPTYKNPEYLDLCLRSAIENQTQINEIIVAVDGFIELSQHVLDKWKDYINVLDLGENQGMQTALNLAVYNATSEWVVIINDDNVLCKNWDSIIKQHIVKGSVITINQIEPAGPGIFNFPVKDFGRTPAEFRYEEFLEYEPTIRKKDIKYSESPDGGIFPFAIMKRDYMIVGGFDTMYQSPFICDWDFFLKLDMNELNLVRIHSCHFYHFGSAATKNGKEGEMFKATEHPAAQTFIYKWGIAPQLFKNNSHRPTGLSVNGITF